MVKISRYFQLIGLVALGLLLSACSIRLDRQPDGSLRMETSMTQEQISTEIRLAISDPTVNDLKVELRNGYIQVTGSRQRPSGSSSDNLTFRMDIKASGGKLSVVVSQAMLNGSPMDKEIIEQWNERIARQLERSAFRNPNASAQSVGITPEAISFVYRIETIKSKSK